MSDPGRARAEGGIMKVEEVAGGKRVYLLSRQPFRVGELTLLEVQVDGGSDGYPIIGIRELGRQRDGRFKCEVVMWEEYPATPGELPATPCPYHVGQIIDGNIKGDNRPMRARVIDVRWGTGSDGLYGWQVKSLPMGGVEA